VKRTLIDSSPGRAGDTRSEEYFASSVAVFSKKSISAMDHPPFSPDLAPAHIWLFSELKSVLKAKRFTDLEDIKSSVEKKK
jgi:hypothetical protein